MRLITLTTAAAAALVLAACGGGSSDSQTDAGTTLTAAYFAMPTDSATNTTTYDSGTGRYTTTYYNGSAQTTTKLEWFSDAEGWKMSKQEVWVPANDWSQRTVLEDGTGKEMVMGWDTPYILFPWGAKVGDEQVLTTQERLIVYSNAAQTANADKCGGTDWDVADNGAAGGSDPYMWTFVEQTRTIKVLAKEDVTLDSTEVVNAFKVEITTEETNNPFNGSPGQCAAPQNYISTTRTFWLAEGRGIVKSQ